MANDNEIDASIDWLWDGGFSVKLGDPDEPVVQGHVRTWREVEAWFRDYGTIRIAFSARKSGMLLRDRAKTRDARALDLRRYD